ncbi:unnamed protein product [Linum trigynum]|uniref:Uncharacterized protein n=1 Tax=Linum trigynum TaxID=586398 RepID=A0AAV2D2S9_9ROSI
MYIPKHHHSPIASHLAIVAPQSRHRPTFRRRPTVPSSPKNAYVAQQFQLRPARPMSSSHPNTAQQGRCRQQIQKSSQIRPLRRSSANRDTDPKPSTVVFG